MILNVVMIVGCPAAGKGTTSQSYIKQGYVHLNRDKEGGKVIDLLPKMEAALKAKKNVVLDNTFPKAEIRKPFIDLAKSYKAQIHCIVLDTSIEDAQINLLFRMVDKYDRFFMTAEEMKGLKDPNVFPPMALFSYRKEYQKPDITEGFNSVETIHFVRNPYPGNNNKCILLDYDGTLRESTGEHPYPTKTSEIKILANRKKVLHQLGKEDYFFVGISNQSGVAKGHLTNDMADNCFSKTNELLNIDIDYYYCPHRIPPMSCYCRKPQSGLGVWVIKQYNLNPSMCTMVGDATTDKTFAKRLGFQFQDAETFFK